MIMQQWHAASTTIGTVTHSCVSSLLISRRLTRPRVVSRYLVRSSSYFKQLTSKLPVGSDNSYVCHECIHMTRSERGNPKIFECALEASS